MYLTTRAAFDISPPTFKSPLIPVPPATVNAPVVVLVDAVVALATRFPLTVPAPATFIIPPTYRFFAIPTPPAVVRDPVTVDVLSTALFMITTPTSMAIPAAGVTMYPRLLYSNAVPVPPTPTYIDTPVLFAYTIVPNPFPFVLRTMRVSPA